MSEVRFYDPADTFLSLATTTDVFTEACQGQGYYPAPPTCENPTVTAVHGDAWWNGFGSGVTVGGTTHLPANLLLATAPSLDSKLALVPPAAMAGCTRGASVVHDEGAPQDASTCTGVRPM